MVVMEVLVPALVMVEKVRMVAMEMERMGVMVEMQSGQEPMMGLKEMEEMGERVVMEVMEVKVVIKEPLEIRAVEEKVALMGMEVLDQMGDLREMVAM